MAEECDGIVGVSKVGRGAFGEAGEHVFGETEGAVNVAFVCTAGGHFGERSKVLSSCKLSLEERMEMTMMQGCGILPHSRSPKAASLFSTPSLKGAVG